MSEASLKIRPLEMEQINVPIFLEIQLTVLDPKFEQLLFFQQR